MVILPYSWEENYTNPKSMPLTHEFGHVWDASTGNLSLQGIVGGVADQLNTYIGGTVVEQNGSRFADGSGAREDGFGNIVGFIPEEYIFQPPSHYGNNSTADYLCEVFSALIYNPQSVPSPEVSNWVEDVIKKQADAFTPPLKPEAIRAPHAPASPPMRSQTPIPPVTPLTSPPPSVTPSSATAPPKTYPPS